MQTLESPILKLEFSNFQNLELFARPFEPRCQILKILTVAASLSMLTPSVFCKLESKLGGGNIFMFSLTLLDSSFEVELNSSMLDSNSSLPKK